MLEYIKREDEEDFIIVKSSEVIQKMLISNLVFEEVIGRNVRYHLNSGKGIECAESFSSACDRLMKYGCFVKPHRSYLVNMKYVDTIENNRAAMQTLSKVPVAHGRAREIKIQYLNYQMEGEKP